MNFRGAETPTAAELTANLLSMWFMWVIIHWSQQNYIVSKKRDAVMRSPNWALHTKLNRLMTRCLTILTNISPVALQQRLLFLVSPQYSFNRLLSQPCLIHYIDCCYCNEHVCWILNFVQNWLISHKNVWKMFGLELGLGSGIRVVTLLVAM